MWRYSLILMTNPKLKYALLTLLMVVASILGNPVCAKTALVSELEGQGWLHLVPLVELLEDPEVPARWQAKREKMLAELIDVNDFILDIVERYASKSK